MLMSTPHLKNINSDPSMSGMIKKLLDEGENWIGKNSKEFSPQIQINGVGISNRHCAITFTNDTREATMHPNVEDPEKFQVKVNGQPVIAEPVILNHGDRILVGTHHYWLYTDPLINPDEQVEWETAMKEANADSLKMLNQDSEDL